MLIPVAKKILLLCLYLFPLGIYAQFIDDFSDGDFYSNLKWEGDTDQFKIVDNLQIQLNATESGKSYLSTTIQEYQNKSLEWHFYIRLAFAPSANNYARFYLASNQQDLTSENLEGFYLHFGENGTEDAVELYYQKDKQHTLICRGKNGTIANSFSYTFKVVKDENDYWKIFIDRYLNDSFEKDSEGSYPYIPSYNHMGIYCQYTASNSSRFYFDDIYFGVPIVDTIKPQIIRAEGLENLNTIRLKFSENITPETALDPANYQIEKSKKHPSSCSFEGIQQNIVLLHFTENFKENEKIKLLISNLADYAENIIQSEVHEIYFHKIVRNDIVITEIMADPSPVVRLPECEYIEVFNRTDYPIVLDKWKIQIGKSMRDLPEMELSGKGFAVIIHENCKEFFNSYTNVYTIPGLNITDVGQSITLYNNEEKVIHTVYFRNKWHTESVKRNGGWALEMIDPNNPCSGASNWNSSISSQGGTLGFANSIAIKNPDLTIPEIEKVTLDDSITLRIYFSETILTDTSRIKKAFQFDRGMKVSEIKMVEPENRGLIVRFTQPLENKKIYSLTIIDSICDCVGMPALLYSQAFFGLPDSAVLNDLIINEIMFDPSENKNGKYIEIYNRSEKIIDLKKVKIGYGGDLIPEKAVTAISEGYLLFPKSYIALCSDKTATVLQYAPLYPNRLINCDSLPSFAKGSGVIHLTDFSFNTIDRFIYNEKMHSEMLTSTKGVALERIHFDIETNNSANWTSASFNYLYGTPGYRNSQFAEVQEEKSFLQISPEIFSPDNNGFDDFTEFFCSFPETENRITLMIYDRQGNKIKTIANNTYCGNEVLFRWDGVCDKGHLAPPDLYIIILEYWNLSGNRGKIRKTIGIR